MKPYPRQFVPRDIDLHDWGQVEKLFGVLSVQPIETVELLEKWLLDAGELQACISEELSLLYLAMMRQTDDKAKEQAYLYFVERVESKCKPFWNELDRRYINASSRADLPKERYQVYDRSKVASVNLYNEANVSLQIEEAKLIQQYDKIFGSMTVQYDGREQTVDEMYDYQLDINRSVRQQAWELVANRRLEACEEINEIFDNMVRVRNQLAHNAGFETFCDYQFTKYNRFDYTTKDCLALHKAVESFVVPVVRSLRARDDDTRLQSLGIETLQPWDMITDLQNRPPLRPFKDTGELCQKCETTFSRIDPVLGSQFAELVRSGWVDIDSRKGKASRGFTQPFGESRCSFIFLNCSGVYDEVDMLLHEGGHALHDLACRDDPLFYYRNDYPLEMAEVAGIGFHLLAFTHLDVFYDDDDRKRVLGDYFKSVIQLFSKVCVVDAFQHWVYAAPKHEYEKRSQYWFGLLERFEYFNPKVYTNNTLAQRVYSESWQKIGHLFRSPFYFIEYAISQIGALQLWKNVRMDSKQAIRQFREALSLGGSKPLPELWATAGLTFEFSEDVLRSLIEDVARELGDM